MLNVFNIMYNVIVAFRKLLKYIKLYCPILFN